MVHTRSLVENSSHEREARVHLKQQSRNTRLTRHVKRVLNGSLSSSDSSDSDSKKLSEFRSSSRRRGRDSSGQTTKQSPQPRAITDLDKEPYMYDSADDSTCSETQILIEAGRLHCTPRNKEFSIPLELVQPTVAKKRENFFRRTRARAEAGLEEILDNEAESSFSDDSLVEKDRRVKKLTRTRRTNQPSRTEFSGSEISDFEIDAARKPPRRQQTPHKRETLFRQARRSSQLTRTPTAKQHLEAEKETSPSNRSTSSTASSVVGEKTQRFESSLNQELAQKRAANEQCQNESSDSDSSESDVANEKQRFIRFPLKYGIPEPPPRTFRKDSSIERSSSVDRRVTRRSISLSCNSDFLPRNIDRRLNDGSTGRTKSADRTVAQRSSVQTETNKTRDDFRAMITKVTPGETGLEEISVSTDRSVIRRNVPVQKQTNEKTTSRKNDFPLRKMRIALTRAEFTPEFLRLRQSEEISKAGTSVAGCSETNKTASQNEANGKGVETHVDIEDLLRQLEGSSDSEEEKIGKKSPVKRKRRELPPRAKPKKSETDNRQYICHVCDQCFASKESLRSHECLHSARTKRTCKFCNKTFTRNDNYVNHLRKHNVDLKSHCVNAFKCDVCKKLFAYRHVLRRHQLMHENRADFKCKTCDQKFVRKDYLEAHERLKHSKNPYFTCGICDKEFAYKHSKILHQRLHTNEKPYKCRICSAAFSRKDNFKKHEVTHQIQRARFICDDCDEVFVNKFALQIHVQDHLKIKEISQKEDYHVEVIQVFINDDWD